MLLAKLGTVYLPTTNSVGASPTSPEPQAGYVATSNNGCESLETRDGKWNDVAGTSPQFFLCESNLYKVRGGHSVIFCSCKNAPYK
jgi:hypothetical protein